MRRVSSRNTTMIRVILNGRTGNNFFQYAAGRALALKHGTRLVLDGSWSDNTHANQFQHLLRLPVAATYERRLTRTKRAFRKVLQVGPETIYQGSFYLESSPEFDPSFHELPESTVLGGFFQSPKYFEEIEPKLRKELDLQRISIPAASQNFEDNLRSQPTVSIHIRRGDYLTVSNTQCLTPDYHELAIRHFRDTLENPRFCIFSDDIPWCRRKFSGPEFFFCDLEGASGDPLHDLRLMSACHHHIIVNSSYSWWAAWLNDSPGKSVVSPVMWMNNFSSESVIPKSWIAL